MARGGFWSTAARGANTLPYPRAGSTGGGLGGPWGAFGDLLGRLLPGSNLDYRREAGDLWDNGIVLAALKWQCRTFPEAPPCVQRLAKGGEWELVPQHPLTVILGQPNPDYDAGTLWQATLLSLGVDGNAYWHKIRSRAGLLVGFRYVPHFLMAPWAAPGEFITGYAYWFEGKAQPVPREDVLHFRDGQDPRNPRKGLSQLGAVLREVVTDNQAATLSAALLRNRGVPPLIISPKPSEGPMIPPSAEDQGPLQTFKQKWLEVTTGENAGMPIFATDAIEVQQLALNPSEMALDALRRMPVDRVCAAMGLDPMVLGLPSNSRTYSNYREAREAAYESNIIPLQRLIATEIQRDAETEGLLKPGKERFTFDLSEVKALQEDQDALHKRAREDFRADVIKRSEARQALGLQAEDATDDLYFSDIQKALQEQRLTAAAQIAASRQGAGPAPSAPAQGGERGGPRPEEPEPEDENPPAGEAPHPFWTRSAPGPELARALRALAARAGWQHQAAAKFEEAQHPRDSHGHFADKPGEEEAKPSAPSGPPRPSFVHAGKDHEERRKKLGIPPGYTNVQLATDETAPHQAVATDAKGRVHYYYTQEHHQQQAAAKFERSKRFTDAMPGIKAAIERDLDGGTRQEEALVLRLVSQTGFRIGSDADTGARKKAYGASTLLAEHVVVEGETVHFDFIGKEGVRQQHSVTDAPLATEIAKRAEGGGRLFETNERKVLAYVKEISGGQEFKTKDFRTYVANRTALRAIMERPAPGTEKEFKAAQKQVAEVVAARLGNKPEMALKAYIDPEVFDRWRTGIEAKKWAWTYR